MTNDQAERILKELEMLRKLKILELTQNGYSQSQVAQVLGVSQPTISRMFPKGTGRKKAAADE